MWQEKVVKFYGKLVLLTIIEKIFCDVGCGGMFFSFGVWVFVGRGYPRLAKGAGLKIRQSLVRDPVAQAFVGSSPTPRTTPEPSKIVEYSEFLR